MNKSIFFLVIGLISSVLISAQDNNTSPKKRLSEDVYESWRNISNQQISNNGKWISYEINPQKGDGYLYLYNVEAQKLDSIARGKSASFSANEEFLVFMIVPQYDTLRNLKLKKTKKSKLPKDSLGVWFLQNDSIIKIANVSDYEITERNSDWITYVDKSKKKKKEENTKKGWWIFKKKDKAPKKKEIKQKGDNIVLFNPMQDFKYNFDFADEYEFSYDGSSLFVLTLTKQDSTNETKIEKYILADKKLNEIFKETGTGLKLTLSRDAKQSAFLFAQDTAKKNKIYNLYYWNENDSSAVSIVDTVSKEMPKGWSPSINFSPNFSKDGSKLYFGTAKRPVQEKKDTLLANEKYHVDIWNYKDPLLQPQQKLQAKREQKRTYLALWDIKRKSMTQLADTIVRSIQIVGDGQSRFALGIDDMKYAREQSWDGWYINYYAVNIFDGSKDQVLEHHQGYVAMSPNGNYIVYFNQDLGQWFSYDIKARKHTNLTKDIGVNFYNELHDTPNKAGAYGLVGWYNNDKYVVIKDRYDFWRIDPTMRSKPINITSGFGRKNKIRFSDIVFDAENHDYFNDENPHYLRAFNDIDKSAGYYSVDVNGGEEPLKLIQSAHAYYYPLKALNANVVAFRRSSFNEYPDLNVTDLSFKSIKKISNTNPQQNEYNWGSVELVHWNAFDGQKLDGLLYKPEDFDSTMKYPVIVYFYERYADDIHRHYIPKPSHSIVNFTEYTSNGYIVFVPDITYKTGHPAKSAYNAIVSGTEFIKKNAWIDGEHIGIQGQSWGGYQVAMLVTMTDIYACAESGAPVSNMISAYGGMRWGSGMNRAFQYEKTQSRIGATPWDSLDLYIENSPIFHAPKVNTPLLIMHNDKDGAVPWYQGIEYFTDLRRLDKKVWMLSYNNDGHNLMKWPNRVDLSIRMMQFFNHYLKGKPMPVWMSKGLPAYKKGKINAYELEKR